MPYLRNSGRGYIIFVYLEEKTSQSTINQQLYAYIYSLSYHATSLKKFLSYSGILDNEKGFPSVRILAGIFS